MDQVKIGAFLAALRKEKQLTQEQLGNLLGVTNKTVSRWENGNYMPDISLLQPLSETLGVSIGELLAGERLTPEQLGARADELIMDAAKNELFSFQERTAFWKKKWKRDHLPGILVQIVLLLATAVVLWFWKESWRVFIIDIAFLGLMVLSLFHRNQMMIYVDHKLYD